MAHLDTRRTWARVGQRVCSPAWLIANLGCFLVTGTALVLLNALTTPANLWFWRPLTLLSVLLGVHGALTLIRCKPGWFLPAVEVARSGWSHLSVVREALLAPAVSGVVAMPGLLTLSNSRRTPDVRPTTAQRTGNKPPATSARSDAPEEIAAPAGWAHPTGSVSPAQAQRDPIWPEPEPAAPVPPAYATWPGMSAAPATTPSPDLTWPTTLASAQTWPDAPAAPASPPASTPFPTWPTEPVPPVRDAESAWRPSPSRSAPPAWHDPWVTANADTAPPPTRPTPPRLIERDITLIGAQRTDPDYPQWDQLEVAASTWLERRASDLDAADSAP